MNTRASGFSLVEVLIVALLTTIVMGAVYQTLTIQQRSTRQLGAVTGTQQTVRTAVQYLEGDLREIGARPGDIVAASATSVTFRALRKIAFTCGTASNTLDVYSYGTPFAAGDTVDIYADNGTQGMSDDQIVRAWITSVSNGAPSCPVVTGSPWSSMHQEAHQLQLTAIDPLNGVNPGALVRSYRTVTYGLYAKGSDWVLGRIQSPPDSAVTIIGSLTSNGLSFQYYDLSNTLIPLASLSTNLNSIARIHITVRAQTRSTAVAGQTYTDSLVSDVFLRGY